MRVGYPIAVLLSVLGLVVLFTGGFGVLDHPAQAALGLVVASLAVTAAQRAHDPRYRARRPTPDLPPRNDSPSRGR